MPIAAVRAEQVWPAPCTRSACRPAGLRWDARPPQHHRCPRGTGV